VLQAAKRHCHIKRFEAWWTTIMKGMWERAHALNVTVPFKSHPLQTLLMGTKLSTDTIPTTSLRYAAR